MFGPRDARRSLGSLEIPTGGGPPEKTVGSGPQKAARVNLNETKSPPPPPQVVNFEISVEDSTV